MRVNAETMADITVYPVFCTYRMLHNLVNNPYICEDDRGRIAFLSKEAKEICLTALMEKRGRRKR